MAKKLSVIVVLFIFMISSCALFAVNDPGVIINKKVEKSVGMIRVDFKATYDGQTEDGAVGGTGWFYDKEHPYLLTNNHVIDVPDVIQYPTLFGNIEIKITEKKYSFIDYKGNKHNCHVIAQCPKLDMAMVKVDDIDTWEALVIGDPQKLEVGEKVYAIGSPLGYLNTFTEGNVSYLNRLLDGLEDEKRFIPWIQHTAIINPGNSGGPLLNANAEVVGINTLSATGNGVSGIYFAVPIDLYKFPWFWKIVDASEFPELS